MIKPLGLVRGFLPKIWGTAVGSRRSFATSRGLHATWGFVGLGRMGFPMAKNLRAKVPTSDSLVIHDINSAVTNQFVEEHAGQNVEIAASVRQISEKAETIITVLPEQHHVQNVLLAMLKPQTLLDIGPAKPRLFIDCSTIDPKSSRAASNAVRASGQGKFVDAPMSGGVVGAAAGTLTFMIGASNELVPPVTEILMKMGKRVLHMGEQGAGLKGKLANNYLLGLNNIATCEAMNMGTKWGLDPQKLAELINTSTGKCWPSEVNNPVPYVVRDSPASKGYEGGFGVSLMKKDLKLALQAAHEVGAASTMGYEALSVYDLVETDENCKGRDFSVVYRYLGGKE